MTAVDDRPDVSPDLPDDDGFDERSDRGYGGRAPRGRSTAREVHPASPLAGLAAKRQRALEELHLDLAVPDYLDRLGIDLYVRFRPIPLSTSQRLVEVARKSKNPERYANANAAALAAACEGIYYLDADGDEHAFAAGDPDGEWPTFDDPVVAQTLGVSYVNAAGLVRDLYWTDEQVAAAVTEVQKWSEGEIREREKSDRGN